MAGRSPARFLAPLALVAFAVALVLVIGGSTSPDSEVERQPTSVENRTETSNGSSERKPARKRSSKKSSKTYTIKAGDTPSGIASANGMTTDELLELNPDLDPNALTVGDEIKIK
jgi:LysM repeat protein